jgi:hypothetical protein
MFMELVDRMPLGTNRLLHLSDSVGGLYPNRELTFNVSPWTKQTRSTV